MLLYIEDKSDGWPPFCLRTIMKKRFKSSPACIASIFLLSFCLARYRKYVQIWLGLVYCFFFFFYFKIVLILSLLLLTLFASSLALVQLGLMFLMCCYFGQKALGPPCRKRQNCQLGSFCDICLTRENYYCTSTNKRLCMVNISISEYDWISRKAKPLP